MEKRRHVAPSFQPLAEEAISQRAGAIRHQSEGCGVGGIASFAVKVVQRGRLDRTTRILILQQSAEKKTACT